MKEEMIKVRFDSLLFITIRDDIEDEDTETECSFAIYKDENGKYYLSICGWGIDEGYKLKHGYEEIFVKEEEKHYFRGEGGVLLYGVYETKEAIKEDIKKTWKDEGYNVTIKEQ